jgi:xanthine dehydrogenase accessory factor
MERIHAPIGLSIGAASPQEIAVAVLAEIIQALRSRGQERSEREEAA